MSKRRVVVTGLGAVTPLGPNVQKTWKNLIASQCGIQSLKGMTHMITGQSYADVPSQVAALVRKKEPSKDLSGSEDFFDIEKYITLHEARKTSPFVHYAIAAATDALADSGWNPTSEADQCRTGVCIGSGIGNLDEIYKASLEFAKSGMRRLSPYFVPRILINLAAGHVAIRHGLKGPNHAVGTACTTGAHSIGDAMRFIQYGDADVMVAGGTEASVSPLAMAGFAKARSLSTNFNEVPSASSRPFDKERDGFVIGEGAGVIVLEEEQHALKRGVKIYAELCGYGLSGDAHHITAPSEQGGGAMRCMEKALEVSQILPKDIDYINAHATSTELGDLAELKAISSVFGTEVNEELGTLFVSSTKGATGHLLGAAGAVESIFTVLTLYHNHIPPTLNLQSSAQEKPSFVDLVPLKGRTVADDMRRSGDGKGLRYALTNSFGFGGTNASLIFKRYEE